MGQLCRSERDGRYRAETSLAVPFFCGKHLGYREWASNVQPTYDRLEQRMIFCRCRVNAQKANCFPQKNGTANDIAALMKRVCSHGRTGFRKRPIFLPSSATFLLINCRVRSRAYGGGRYLPPADNPGVRFRSPVRPLHHVY